MNGPPPPCDEAARLGRLARASADPQLLEHIQRCPTCQKEWSSLHRLTTLAGALPPPAGQAARRELLRARLVASAANLAPPRGRLGKRALVGASALAAAAGAMVVLRSAHDERPAAVAEPATAGVPPRATHRGRVEARGPATYSWSSLPDEVVRLSEGRIAVRVAPLGPGERFRVVSGDAEIEVHGTSFEVVVAGDRLVAVNVSRGLVAVRPAGSPASLLGPAEEWHPAPPPEAHAQRARERPARRAVAGLQPPPAPDAPATPAERAFADGWRALRVGSYVDAAAAFGRAASAGSGEPLAEDALYWRAVAEARAEHSAEARASMARFLEQYPASRRAGEMAAMLGWLLLDVRQDQEAARVFALAARDRSAKVRASAEAGQAAVERRAGVRAAP
jgi:TolA-binding protein